MVLDRVAEHRRHCNTAIRGGQGGNIGGIQVATTISGPLVRTTTTRVEDNNNATGLRDPLPGDKIADY